MCKERSKYRRLCRTKKSIFNKKEAENMFLLSKSNPKQFWKKVKRNKSKNKSPDMNFYDHFKEL